MNTHTIPARSIFIEQEGWAYYVANWQTRFVEPLHATMVRLSPRHFLRYCELKAKGRGQKTIAYLLFKKIPVLVVDNDRVVSKTPSTIKNSQKPIITVDINTLKKMQLALLIQRSLHGHFPGLHKLSAEELRVMYLSMQARRVTKNLEQPSAPSAITSVIKSGIEHA